jgi:3-methylcrotonyl-CoA carboxylase alpha subunit
MPGRVVAWLATPGGDVEKNTPLLILEAMKMEHTITAPAAGRLVGFRFAVGEQVTEGAELVDFEKRA